MIENSENRLTEGKMYLMGFNSNYNPNLREHQRLYTFQFISESLIGFEFDSFIHRLIEVIIFDSIIGNFDRHQENWGIITNYNQTIKGIDKHLETKVKNFFTKQKFRIAKWYLKLISKAQINMKRIPKSILAQQSSFAPNVFAPIYDSGCCLGREIEEERLNKMLLDNNMLEAYVRKGESEIHWEGFERKKKHFELVNLVKEIHKDKVSEVIDRVVNKYKNEDIKAIIFNIDKNIPSNLSQYKLADNRKELMNKIINLRIEKLKEIR
jgi:hypothetical protein